MIRRLLLFLTLATVFVGCREDFLVRGNWAPEVHKALDELIKEEGSFSRHYDEGRRPYAVFDFDNTTILSDISVTLMVYQIDSMRFAFPPDSAFKVFTASINDVDMELIIPGKEYHLTVRSLAEDLAADYAVLYGRHDYAHLPEYQDFRVKLWNLAWGVNCTMDYGTSCLWITTLFDGMTRQEIKALARESVMCWQRCGRIWQEEWACESLSAKVPKGLALTPEMRSLYQSLKDNGIDVYVCSASLEEVVEAMACDAVFGLGLDTDHVFGLRVQEHEDGTIKCAFAEDYAQPFKAGKVTCIEQNMMPLQGGRAPILVGGDSNGDYEMLTAFPEMRVGLIINCGNGGGIGELSKQALSDTQPLRKHKGPKYLLQGRDLKSLAFVPGSGSEK